MESSVVYQRDSLLRAALERLADDCLAEKCSDAAALLRLGQALDLCSADRVQFNGEVFRLTDILQHHATVVRFYVSGSYGRRVTVGLPRVDLVIFVKTSVHGLPPYNVPAGGGTGVSLLARLHEALATKFANAHDVTVFPLRPPAAAAAAAQQQQPPDERCGTGDCSCCDDESRHTIVVQAGSVHFRIFVAPALGKTSEEQRHGAYRHMRTLHAQYGPQALVPWHAALLERPSEIVAFESHKVQAFIRLCQLWVMLQDVSSLDPYAVEMMAYGVSRQLRLKTLQQQQSKSAAANDSSKRGAATESPIGGGGSGGGDENRASRGQLTRVEFDLHEALTAFLTLWASRLSQVSKLHDTVSPASFLSTAADEDPHTPFYSDFFNQYRNLLKGLRPCDKDVLERAAKEKLALLQHRRGYSAPIRDLFAPLHSSAATSSSSSGKGRRCRRLRVSSILAVLVVCVALTLAVAQQRGLVVVWRPSWWSEDAAAAQRYAQRSGEVLFRQLSDTLKVHLGKAAAHTEKAAVHLQRMGSAAAVSAEAGFADAKRYWTDEGLPFVKQCSAQLGETVSRLKSTAVDYYQQYRAANTAPPPPEVLAHFAAAGRETAP